MTEISSIEDIDRTYKNNFQRLLQKQLFSITRVASDISTEMDSNGLMMKDRLNELEKRLELYLSN